MTNVLFKYCPDVNLLCSFYITMNKVAVKSKLGIESPSTGLGRSFITIGCPRAGESRLINIRVTPEFTG